MIRRSNSNSLLNKYISIFGDVPLTMLASNVRTNGQKIIDRKIHELINDTYKTHLSRAPTEKEYQSAYNNLNNLKINQIQFIDLIKKLRSKNQDPIESRTMNQTTKSTNLVEPGIISQATKSMNLDEPEFINHKIIKSTNVTDPVQIDKTMVRSADII